MDIDFITDLTEGFQISITDNPNGVSGNRAMVNRFECTFFTKMKRYTETSFDPATGIVSNKDVIDPYGGDVEKYLNSRNTLQNVQGVAAALNIAIEQTVRSMKNDQSNSTPDTEKVQGAKLNEISIVSGVVVATIEIIPVEAESYETLKLNLPITKIGV